MAKMIVSAGISDPNGRQPLSPPISGGVNVKHFAVGSPPIGTVKAGGRLVKHARYYWLLSAEGHLNRQRFGAMLGRLRCWRFRRDRRRRWCFRSTGSMFYGELE